MTVRFGPPLTYQYQGETVTTGQCAAPVLEARDLDADELRALTDALMAEIARLSGQEYVDHYANRRRAE